MPRVNRPRAITGKDKSTFVPVSIWPDTRDVLNRVAEKRNITLCLLIDNFAKRAEKESFRDEAD